MRKKYEFIVDEITVIQTYHDKVDKMLEKTEKTLKDLKRRFVLSLQFKTNLFFGHFFDLDLSLTRFNKLKQV
jgi:hypothetical protein